MAEKGQDIRKNHMENIPQIKEEVLYSGDWLRLKKLTYTDAAGKERIWESASKITESPQTTVDAVCILAILRRILKYDCIICLKQFRPPVNAYTIEFPAGLVEANEDVATAALRELKEETGYEATVKHISSRTCLHASTENTTQVIVTAEVDGDDIVNKEPKKLKKNAEVVDVLLIPVDELLSRLNDLAKEGIVIDSTVYSYAVAQTMARKEHKLVPGDK